MHPTVAVFGTLRFPPENLQEVLPHLKALMEATIQIDGCLAYEPSTSRLRTSSRGGPLLVAMVGWTGSSPPTTSRAQSRSSSDQNCLKNSQVSRWIQFSLEPGSACSAWCPPTKELNFTG